MKPDARSLTKDERARAAAWEALTVARLGGALLLEHIQLGNVLFNEATGRDQEGGE